MVKKDRKIKSVKDGGMNMGSIHFFAVKPEEKLAEGPWFEYRGNRTLTDEERKRIKGLSRALEDRTYAWIDELNKSAEWKKYYSDRFHRWFEGVRRADGEEIKPATELYLYPRGGELYSTGMEVEGYIFFGFLNLDDVECDIEIDDFLKEYVRRLSIIITDLLWLFDYREEAYYRGMPIIIKRKGTKYPARTAPARNQIPKYVRDALGTMEIPPPETCQFCKKTDIKVTPQYLNKLTHAHEGCLLEFYKQAHELKMV